MLQQFVVARLVLAHDEGVNLLAFGDDYFRRGTREPDGVCWTQLRFGVNGLGDDCLLLGKEPLRFDARGSSPAVIVPVGAFHRFDSPLVPYFLHGGSRLLAYPGRPVDFTRTSTPQRLQPAFLCES